MIEALFQAYPLILGIIRKDLDETSTRNPPLREWNGACLMWGGQLLAHHDAVDVVLESGGEAMETFDTGIVFPFGHRLPSNELGLIFKQLTVFDAEANVSQVRDVGDRVEEIRQLQSIDQRRDARPWRFKTFAYLYEKHVQGLESFPGGLQQHLLGREVQVSDVRLPVASWQLTSEIPQGVL